MAKHGLPAGISVLLGVVVAILVNALTDTWRWPVGIGLGAAVLVAAAWEVRLASRADPATSIRARRTGSATASGHASRANSGITGKPSADATIHRTGDARATGGGTANTGIDGLSQEKQ
jgi:hypothetical protein